MSNTIDGKHIAIRKSRGSGSTFFNYTGFFSIGFLAMVNRDYKFLWANVGVPGSNSDCGINNQTDLEHALREKTIDFPDTEPLPHDGSDIPYFLVGDNAFALQLWMVKLYSHQYFTREERSFNFRLSRYQRVVRIQLLVPVDNTCNNTSNNCQGGEGMPIPPHPNSHTIPQPPEGRP